MFDKNRIKQDFSKASAYYDLYAGVQQHVLAELVKKTRPFLLPHARILDAGCGTGQLSTLLTGFKPMGIDIAYGMCTQASKRGCAVANGSLESLPFRNESFDAVFSSLVLQWIYDREAAMSEMKRVLRPGGILAVSTFGSGTLHELKASFAASDDHPHISEFASEKDFEYTEIITEYFTDLQAIMAHLKAVGARNKITRRNKSLMTTRQLQAVEKYYRRHFATENGLPVTWKVLYSVSRKL